MLDLAVAIPTLVGSYLSMFAAGSVFVCYLILPPQKHYRHTLIMNLAGAGEQIGRQFCDSISLTSLHRLLQCFEQQYIRDLCHGPQEYPERFSMHH